MSSETQAPHRMTLHRLTLDHFKSFEHLVLEFGGADATIFGANGAGKTTVADAWQWLLFGKDTANRKDFAIKTLDPFGGAVHHQTHSVEAELTVGETPVTLRRVYTEKWTKKRGKATADFAGHTTDYFVDGVPVSPNEFLASVPGIADEEVFRMVTTPTYFNEQLSWKDRRHYLMRLAGEPDDAAIIAAHPDLAELNTLRQGRPVVSYRQALDLQRKQGAQDLASIPARIDELARGLGGTPRPADVVEAELAGLRSQVTAKHAERTALTAGGEVARLRGRLLEIDSDRQQRVHEVLSPVRERQAQIERDLRDAQDHVARIDRLYKEAVLEADRHHEAIAALTPRIEAKRAAWQARNAETFTPPDAAACPTCGQALPEDAVAAAQGEALATFNQRKSADLTAIQAEGKTLAAELASRQATAQATVERMEALQKERVEAEGLVQELAEALRGTQESTVDVDVDPRIQALDAERAQIEAQLAAPALDVAPAQAALDAEIHRLDEQIAALTREQVQAQEQVGRRQRIDALSAQEKTLTRQLEEVERQLALCDAFTQRKVEAMEAAINQQFGLVRWKLFEQQLNGGVADTCVCLVNGVPYPDLNHARKIQAGLDIIQQLQQISGLVAPIFIDGKESVSYLPDLTAQVIALTVSPEDARLRVVLSNSHEKVAI